MSRSDETMYRQWVMLAHIPRYPRTITVPELSQILLGEGYTVDVRTIQRDLNKLSISFPLSNDVEGRKNYWFWIEDAAILDLPSMEPVTALAFKMAESYLLPILPKATLDLLSPYFARAKEILNSQQDSSLGSWADKVRVIERGPTLLKPTITENIQYVVYQALLEEKCIKASYKGRGQTKNREYHIHPLGIVSRMGVIYLICTLWSYSEIKQFALHRFTAAEIVNEKSQKPDDYSLASYIDQNEEFSYVLSSSPLKLKALFDAHTAQHLAETPLSPDQKLVKTDDGRIMITATVTDSLELQWWLQGFGEKVEVLEPESLRDKLRDVFKKLAERYA